MLLTQGYNMWSSDHEGQKGAEVNEKGRERSVPGYRRHPHGGDNGGISGRVVCDGDEYDRSTTPIDQIKRDQK